MVIVQGTTVTKETKKKKLKKDRKQQCNIFGWVWTWWPREHQGVYQQCQVQKSNKMSMETWEQKLNVELLLGSFEVCGYEEKEKREAPEVVVCFVFKHGRVFIVFEEDVNKAEAREREVINWGQGGDNRESDQELKGITHPMQWRLERRGTWICFCVRVKSWKNFICFTEKNRVSRGY